MNGTYPTEVQKDSEAEVRDKKRASVGETNRLDILWR